MTTMLAIPVKAHPKDKRGVEVLMSLRDWQENHAYYKAPGRSVFAVTECHRVSLATVEHSSLCLRRRRITATSASQTQIDHAAGSGVAP